MSPPALEATPSVERSLPREWAASPRPHAVAKGNVLLVDDSLPILAAYARILQAAGFSVMVVSDGRQVRRTIDTFRPDVILTDVVMPMLDGVEILRGVRERNPDIAVVLMSGTADIGSALQAVEHGAFRYLQKPIDAASLTRVVEEGVAVRRMSEVKRRALEEFGRRSDLELTRANLATRFEQALRTVHMVYQPIVRCSDRTVLGYEALVRSREVTLSQPRDLLLAATELDRLHDLGRIVRSSVAETMQRYPESGRMFVNVHPRDLEDGDLLSSGSPLGQVADRVVLEVTEWATFDLVCDVQSRFNRLRMLGYRLALDDLGAGYAGLTSFAQLRPEIVKLDMSLTRGVTEEPIKKKLVESMTGLCRELGLLMIAEGVETAAERDALVALGCDLFQGHLFAAPAFPLPQVSWTACDRTRGRLA